MVYVRGVVAHRLGAALMVSDARRLAAFLAGLGVSGSRCAGSMSRRGLCVVGCRLRKEEEGGRRRLRMVVRWRRSGERGRGRVSLRQGAGRKGRTGGRRRGTAARRLVLVVRVLSRAGRGARDSAMQRQLPCQRVLGRDTRKKLGEMLPLKIILCLNLVKSILD
jgi:hypothetical protein